MECTTDIRVEGRRRLARGRNSEYLLTVSQLVCNLSGGGLQHCFVGCMDAHQTMLISLSKRFTRTPHSREFGNLPHLGRRVLLPADLLDVSTCLWSTILDVACHMRKRVARPNRL